MLRHGAPIWTLWVFGTVTIPLGFWLWNRQAIHFGFGSTQGQVNRWATYQTAVAAALLIALGLAVGGE